ncbi:MAG: tautomerase family protein [Clostridia bacterium]|nr:tautomerase family protein [Clostridia bacterium]
MPIVSITMWSGRSPEQKKQLAEAITNEMIKIIGLRRESIQIIFNDIEKQNWAIGGKIPD